MGHKLNSWNIFFLSYFLTFMTELSNLKIARRRYSFHLEVCELAFDNQFSSSVLQRKHNIYVTLICVVFDLCIQRQKLDSFVFKFFNIFLINVPRVSDSCCCIIFFWFFFWKGEQTKKERKKNSYSYGIINK